MFVGKIILFLLFVSLSVISLTIISCDTTEPKLDTYHNKILFTSNRNGKEQLYMMNPDGTNIVQITNGKYSHSGGRWSPDAKQIVCNTEEKMSTAGISMAVMNSDGSNRRLLGYGNQITWHPDGSKIIFSYWPGSEIGIYDIKLFSIEPNGNDRKVISEKYAGSHTFSPDGTHIAFSVELDSVVRIAVLDYPQFENPHYIGPAGAILPNWSPNGNEITFSAREIPTEPGDIYIMNSDGSNQRRITNNTSSMPYIDPRWSPGGDKIIFLAITVDGTHKWYLYMVNIDGTDFHRVIDDSTVTSCDW